LEVLCSAKTPSTLMAPSLASRSPTSLREKGIGSPQLRPLLRLGPTPRGGHLLRIAVVDHSEEAIDEDLALMVRKFIRIATPREKLDEHATMLANQFLGVHGSSNLIHLFSFAAEHIQPFSTRL